MQTVSELYKRLWRSGAARELRLTIAGQIVPSEKVLELKRSSGLYFDTLSIGNAASASLTVKLWRPDPVPWQAQVTVEERLTDGTQASEWLAGGTYWVDTRESVEDALVLTCYDSMMKAETQFFTTGAWLDLSMKDCAEEIAERMGVTIDPRTTLSDTYKVRYPNDMTMREVLMAIAAAHGGNWIITPANQLRLLRLGETPEETYYMVTEYGDALTLGSTRLRWR